MNEVNYFPWRCGDAEKYFRDVDSLIKALNNLPVGSKVTVNATGNLAVVDSDFEQIGYIEIRDNAEDANLY